MLVLPNLTNGDFMVIDVSFKALLAICLVASAAVKITTIIITGEADRW